MQNISVAICTWNRQILLKETLSRMAVMEIPGGLDWELLLIDNNSSDETFGVVSEFQGVLPIRYVKECEQGLSHARNRAAADAKSRWLIFTDDDVLVPVNWLTNYSRGLANLPEDVVFVGGGITPWFPQPPSPAMMEAIPMVRDGFCARSVPEQREITLESSYFPFGANFAVRTDVAKTLQFDPSLGVNGKNRVLGEEVVFMIDMLRKGYTGRWIEDVSVRHYVDPKRLELKSLAIALRDAGKTRARRNYRMEGRFRIADVPGWVYFDLARGFYSRFVPQRLVRDRVKFFKRLQDFWFYYGYLTERCKISMITRKRSWGRDLESKEDV